MKVYQMERDEDVSGLSGTGVVADVAEFSDGVVVLRWRGPYKSTVVFDDLATAIRVHGHDGRTRFVPVLELTPEGLGTPRFPPRELHDYRLGDD